ncbi:TetR family transcriptional regulator [Nostoc sp. CENA543]|nr:TetR family transcriptional regulator [Nostoc sp. CENA543]
MNHLMSRTAHTRSRLIKAATEVFADAGLTGATTREIARVAGVNEVTLFRHFQTKEQLLAAVIQQAMALQAQMLAYQDEWTQDLQIDLRHYARLCNRMMEEHEALIRTFIGEAKRNPEVARQILYDADQALREQLVTYLKKAQNKGKVRTDVDLRAAVDSFTGMLLYGMLRRGHATGTLGYSRACYIETCVQILLSSLEI